MADKTFNGIQFPNKTSGQGRNPDPGFLRIYVKNGNIYSVDSNGNDSQLTGTVDVLNDISDITISNPSTGQVLKYNGSVWVNGTDTGGGGATVTSSDTDPENPSVGDLWFDSNNVTLNVYYDDGTSQQWVAASGPAGPQGTTGFVGSQGTIGYTGSQGAQGIQGNQGIQGPIGYTGSQGIQGIQGDTGFTGSQGVIGYSGSQGIQGIQGDTGFTGSQGVIGYSGSQGPQGIQGDTGFVGSKGIQGNQGVQGPIGYTGSQGIQGNQGNIGFTGSQGAIGYSGSQGIQGIQGDTGFVGSQGAIGFTGSQGSQGTQGVIGYSGSRGVIGYSGSKGDQGVIGYSGSQGAIGYTGSQGATTFDALSDVTITSPAPNQLIVYNNSTSQWENASSASFDSLGINENGTMIFTADDASGVVRLESPASVTGLVQTFKMPGEDGASGDVLTTDGSGNLSFTTPSGGGGGASVEVGTTAPVTPSEGDLWWDSDDGRLYIYYNDGDSTQWIEASPATQGPIGFTGSQGTTGFVGSLGSQGPIGYTGSAGGGGTATNRSIVMSLVFG